MQRVLIVNPFGIGDVLFTTPVIDALKRWQPSVQLGFLCNARTAPMLARDPRIERLVVYEKSAFRRAWHADKGAWWRMASTLWRELRGGRFDAALDFSLAEEFGLALMLAGIRRRVGLDYRRRGKFLTQRIFCPGFDDRPIGEYYLDAVRALEVPVDGAQASIWTSSADERTAETFLASCQIGNRLLIGMAPGGGEAFGPSKAWYKRWGEAHFAQLAKLIVERLGAVVVVFVGPGEESLGAAIVREAPDAMRLADRLTVCEMASLMRRCRLVITNDGGPMHVAVAAGVPSVSLFGPTDPQVYGPYPRNPDRHRVITQPVVCSPCYRRFKLPECAGNVCLSWIEPAQVLAVVEDMTRGIAARVSGRAPSAS